jgi:hypothetical protein
LLEKKKYGTIQARAEITLKFNGLAEAKPTANKKVDNLF